MSQPNLVGKSIGEIREYVRQNRKHFAEMSDRELKEYVITVPDDKEAEQEYISRSTAEVVAKRNAYSERGWRLKPQLHNPSPPARTVEQIKFS